MREKKEREYIFVKKKRDCVKKEYESESICEKSVIEKERMNERRKKYVKKECIQERKRRIV